MKPGGQGSHIEVGTSDYAIAKAPHVLTTFGIGSCVAICLYHEASQLGALLHIMLPRAEGNKLNPLRFADTALSYVLVELAQKHNAPKHQLTAKLIGGAQMFHAPGLTQNIGARNSSEAKLLLAALGIALKSEDTGGTRGRSLEFDLSTGLVTVYTKSS